jgi:hypothetical protein
MSVQSISLFPSRGWCDGTPSRAAAANSLEGVDAMWLLLPLLNIWIVFFARFTVQSQQGSLTEGEGSVR